MENLNGKVGVVTGAASGIGRSMAERFCKEGMAVVLADIEEESLNEAVDQNVKACGTEAMELNNVIVLTHAWVSLDDGSDPLNECL